MPKKLAKKDGVTGTNVRRENELEDLNSVEQMLLQIMEADTHLSGLSFAEIERKIKIKFQYENQAAVQCALKKYHQKGELVQVLGKDLLGTFKKA